MFDEELFFKLCQECGAEITENENGGKLLIELENGEETEITEEILNSIIGEPIYEELSSASASDRKQKGVK